MRHLLFLISIGALAACTTTRAPQTLAPVDGEQF